jgi:hypothetical protein
MWTFGVLIVVFCYILLCGVSGQTTVASGGMEDEVTEIIDQAMENQRKPRFLGLLGFLAGDFILIQNIEDAEVN